MTATTGRTPDTHAEPDVQALVSAVHDRLQALDLSESAASKFGTMSRSTLTALGKDGRVPQAKTLKRLDELLNWTSGSAKATL